MKNAINIRFNSLYEMNYYSIYLHGQAICELSFSFVKIDTITK